MIFLLARLYPIGVAGDFLRASVGKRLAELQVADGPKKQQDC